jgi:hypothetical protein
MKTKRLLQGKVMFMHKLPVNCPDGPPGAELSRWSTR